MGWKTRSVVAGAATMVLAVGPVAAASAVDIAFYDMNEAPGATEMVNSLSGPGTVGNGNIGPDVVLGENTPDGGKAYRFKGDWWIPNDDRLIQIPDQDGLDPGTGTFRVEFKIKTGAADPNIAQKGQSETSGGMWKFVLKKGWPRCHFRDDNHVTAAIGFVNSIDPETKVNDGTWHVLRCERTLTGVRVTIDPDTPEERTKFLRKTIGTINNKFPMTIGGKLACDHVTVTCDYYAGAMDWLRISRP